jgi:hypothetical protein
MTTKKIASPQEAYNIVHGKGFTLGTLQTISVSENFTWAEVFTNRTMSEVQRAGMNIFQNAFLQAGRLEKIRAFLRQRFGPIAMDVSSWYRSTAANMVAKGATGSSHLLALATDFTVRGYESADGNRRIQAYLITMKDKIGYCLEITNGQWTHVDGRPAHIVFENLGKGQYRTWGIADMKAFMSKYGVPL